MAPPISGTVNHTVSPFFTPRNTHCVNQRLRRLVLVGVVLLLAACGGNSEPAPVVPDVNLNAPNVGPTAQDDSLGTTTIAGAVSTTEPPESTQPPDIRRDRIYLAVSGDDASSGADPGQAVRTLDRALDVLLPGGTVFFQEGVYEPLELDGIQGTEGLPIRLEAVGRVEFRDDDYSSGAGILIHNSEHLEVVGMVVRRSLWGIYIDNSSNIAVLNNDIGDIGQEGIRVKGGSFNVVIDRNVVADTGRRDDNGPANGEGIYLGTGSPGGVDLVQNITVTNNQISRTTDEAIDVKHPVTNVDIIGNTITDVVTQTSGAIVIHLNGDQSGDPMINIERNLISNVTRSSPYRDGNCIVAQVTVRIVNNVMANCQHRGIFLRGNAGTATVLHNTLVNTGSFGSIVNEGRGMEVISENNLGADGADNRPTSIDIFVDMPNGDFRLDSASPADLRQAPNVGVSVDVLGAARPAVGPVTFGAHEALPVTN